MNQKKENLLNIQYHLQKGLIFSWNLGGLLNKDFYVRHLFVLNSENQSFLESIIALICLKVKIGDFVAFLYKKKGKIGEKLKWCEKTTSSFDKLHFRGFQKITSQELIEMLPFLAKQTNNYSNPVMVNIFTDEIDEIAKYKVGVQQLRVEGHFPYHVNFFGNFSYHNIATSTGFNEINANEDTITEILSIYKSLSSETAVLKMKVELDFSSTQVTTRKDNIWHVVDFGRIRRIYYGPSIHYEQDCIGFIDETMNRTTSSIPMLISLQVTLFSGKVLRAQKSFILTIDNIKLYSMTKCDNYQPRSTYEFAKIFRSKTQPFRSTTSLVITKLTSS